MHANVKLQTFAPRARAYEHVSEYIPIPDRQRFRTTSSLRYFTKIMDIIIINAHPLLVYDSHKNVSVVHECIRSMSLTHGVSKQHAYLISYLTNKVDCLYLMSTVAIYIYTLLYNNHLLSTYSAEIEPRIKIFMLKLVCGQNFVLFGHSGHEL